MSFPILARTSSLPGEDPRACTLASCAPSRRHRRRGLTLGGLARAPAVAQPRCTRRPQGQRAQLQHGVLSWEAVGKATSYEVQVDNTPHSPRLSSPPRPEQQGGATKTLMPGKNYWRVRATGDGKTVRAGPRAPSPSAGHHAHPARPRQRRGPRPAAGPAAAPVEQQPGRRRPTRRGRRRRGHARREDLHHQDHVLGRHRPADDRRLVLAGDRQQGQRAEQPPVRRRRASTSRPLPAPQITYPANDVNQASRTSCSTGRRCPAPQLRHAGSARRGLQQHHLSFTDVARHAVLAAHDAEQRPVLVAGPGSRPRRPADAVDRVAVTASSASGSTNRSRSTPDRHRRRHGPSRSSSGRRCSTRPTTSSHVATDANMSHRPHQDLQTAQHHVRAARTSRRLRHSRPGERYWWGVRAIDYPYRGDCPASSPCRRRSSGRTDPAGGACDPNAAGHRTSRSPSTVGIANGAKGCKVPAATEPLCTGVPTTPVLSWDPVPGARPTTLRRPGRELHHERDPDGHHDHPMLPLQVGNDQRARCRTARPARRTSGTSGRAAPTAHCARPGVQRKRLPDTRSFRKASPASRG